MSGFLHGIEVLQMEGGARSVTTPASSVIGLIGTADNANANAFPLNTPVAVLKPADGAALGPRGGGGTLGPALDAIFDQARTPVVVVRVAAGVDANATLGNLTGSASQGTGVHAFKAAKGTTGLAPRLLIAPGFTAQRPQGVTAITVTNGGSGYTEAPAVTLTGSGGARAEAAIEDGAVTAVTLTHGGAGYTRAPAVSFSGGGGVGARASASVSASANPVVAEMLGIARSLRAIIIADGPGADTGSGAATASGAATMTGAATMPGAADAAAIAWAGDFDCDRLYLVEPGVRIWDEATHSAMPAPASARVAGAIARRDGERGFWHSPSNQSIAGIVGTTRPIEFSMSEAASQSNLLNDKKIAVIIRQNGFRLWGNRTLASDPAWAFLPVRRTADMVFEAIEHSFLWAVDRPQSAALISDIVSSVNAYLRSLIARGALLGGRAWFDPDVNGRAELAAGRLTIDFELEPPAPAERITFRAHRNGEYYTELAATAATAAA